MSIILAIRKIAVLFFLTVFWHTNYAQDVHVNSGSVVMQFSINESSLIYDKSTGQRISYEEYNRLIKANLKAYRTDLLYNEFGEICGFNLRSQQLQSRKMAGVMRWTSQSGQKQDLLCLCLL